MEASRRLLTDPTIPTADRVAGPVGLLYGRRASTISQLTLDDIALSSRRHWPS